MDFSRDFINQSNKYQLKKKKQKEREINILVGKILSKWRQQKHFVHSYSKNVFI